MLCSIKILENEHDTVICFIDSCTDTGHGRTTPSMLLQAGDQMTNVAF